MRLVIMLENSGTWEEKSWGVQSILSHILPWLFQLYGVGLQCSFAGSQLPGTHMNGVMSAREGERRTTSEFSSRELKADHRGSILSGTIQHWQCTPGKRKSSDKWSQLACVDCGPRNENHHSPAHQLTQHPKRNAGHQRCVPAHVPSPSSNAPDPLKIII